MVSLKKAILNAVTARNAVWAEVNVFFHCFPWDSTEIREKS